MKALVTGGGGFLGGAIVRLLRERGESVRSFSRGNYRSLDALGVEQARGDLSDPAAVRAAAKDCDIVFHVAAKAGVWGPWKDYFDANVIGTRNVIAACREHGIRKLVFTGSPSSTFAGKDQDGVNESEPYPKRFLAHYPHTKAIAEQELLAANGPDLATVSLRPHLIWGPGDPHIIPRIVERARAGKLRRIGTRPLLVDTTYIDNAAMAHVNAAERLDIGLPIAGKAYYISQGEPEPLWDFIARVLAAAGLPPVSRTISPTLAYIGGSVLECVYHVFRLPGEPTVTRFVAKQMSTSHWYDLTAARRDLSYSPAVSTDEGLLRVRDWLRSAPG